MSEEKLASLLIFFSLNSNDSNFDDYVGEIKTFTQNLNTIFSFFCLPKGLFAYQNTDE